MANAPLLFPMICLTLSAIFILCVYHRSIRGAWQQAKQACIQAYRGLQHRFRIRTADYRSLRSGNRRQTSFELLEVGYHADISSNANSDTHQNDPLLPRRRMLQARESRKRIKGWLKSTRDADDWEVRCAALKSALELNLPKKYRNPKMSPEQPVDANEDWAWWTEAVTQWGIQNLHDDSDGDYTTTGSIHESWLA